MAMTETQRTTLYHHLTDAIGQDAARTLMEQLPPSGWDQVATKDDIEASEARLLRDLDARQTRLKGEVLLAIAASESGQSARIDETNVRIDGTNTRHRRNQRTNRRNQRTESTGPTPASTKPTPGSTGPTPGSTRPTGSCPNSRTR